MKKLLVFALMLTFAACASDNKTEEEKKESETVSDQIEKDKLRADSMLKAMQKKADDAVLDTNVKVQEPAK